MSARFWRWRAQVAGAMLLGRCRERTAFGAVFLLLFLTLIVPVEGPAAESPQDGVGTPLIATNVFLDSNFVHPYPLLDGYGVGVRPRRMVDRKRRIRVRIRGARELARLAERSNSCIREGQKMRRAVLWVAAIAIGQVLVTWDAARADIFGANLIVNPGAEDGQGAPDESVVPVPGWTTTSNFTVVQYDAAGGFPLSTDPGPAARGLNFFAGGPANPISDASQLIDVSTGAATIDAAAASFDLEAYLGGFDAHDDYAVLTIDFHGALSQSIGIASIGPVSAIDRGFQTGLLLRSTSGNVPVGTRSIFVSLAMTRELGNYNDGYADNLSLTLLPEPSTAVAAVVLGVTAIASRVRRRRCGSSDRLTLR